MFKIVVIDDDPTGSQVVHGCPLLFQWDLDSLRVALRNPSPLLFVLANTRSLSPDDAACLNRSIALNLDNALKAEGLNRRNVFLVSRGDSTLRGHGFLEPAVLQDCFGPFDATFHCPAFLEGGRTTSNGIHYLDGKPVHTTSFARDALFGFSTSHLPSWLVDKSDGALSFRSIREINICELEFTSGIPFLRLLDRLRSLEGNVPVVVNAQSYEYLNCFSLAVRTLRKEKRFLFRSAASLLRSLADLNSPSLSSRDLSNLRLRDSRGQPLPGLVMVGSFVPLADLQISRLLSDPRCVPLEIPVSQIFSLFETSLTHPSLNDIRQTLLSHLRSLLHSGFTPVLFTTRGEFSFDSPRCQRRFSLALANFTSSLAVSVASEIGYLISKGGITTHTLLARGMALHSVQLEGQILPGLSMVRPTDGPFRHLPVLTFPGNLGSSDTLFDAWKLMQAC